MALRIGTLLPSLIGATEWLNTPVSSDELIGNPVIVHFWAISCPFCVKSMSNLESWRQAYTSYGLRFVAVHLPRYDADKNLDEVKEVLQSRNITWPCAIDNEHIIGNRFEMDGIWPYYFLFDAQGEMRSRAAGDAGLKLLENALKRAIEKQTVSL